MTIYRSLDAHADYIVEENSSGRTVADLAREFGVTGKVIKRILKSKGIVTRSSTKSIVDEDGIVRFYASGNSENSTSKHFGVSRTVVRRILTQRGAHIRSQSESETLKWSGMTPEARSRQVRRAHEATKGAPVPIERRVKAAQSKERNKTVESPFEQSVIDMLMDRGVDFTIQKAIGVHNACLLYTSPSPRD